MAEIEKGQAKEKIYMRFQIYLKPVDLSCTKKLWLQVRSERQINENRRNSGTRKEKLIDNFRESYVRIMKSITNNITLVLSTELSTKDHLQNNIYKWMFS